LDIYKEALLLHKDKVGKIDVISKVKTENMHDLALAYSPGVAQMALQCWVLAISAQEHLYL
jgi:malate dehydrogenase (oxaloacetate-decarboxylating)